MTATTSPRELRLTESALNGRLSEAGELAFAELLAKVRDKALAPTRHVC